jgi:FtsX-like permease family/MacB-like periplasmic core domain
MFARVRSLFHVLTSRRDFEGEMAEELRFHIDQYAEQLVRSGVSPDEAHRRAYIEFGGLSSVKADCREALGLRMFDEFARELRYAARLFRRSPGFTVTALLTLALCIGANLTIFAVIDAVLLRPLPFPRADRLVTIFNTYPKAGVERDGASITNYYERRGRIPAFSSLSIYAFGTAIIGEPGSTERQEITRVSPDFFTTLSAAPVIGRSLTDAETTYQTDGKSAATVKGYVLPRGESLRGHYSYGVGGDYFQAMGLSLWAGRFLTGADSRRGVRTCVVDEDFARHYWPHSTAIGHLLFQGSDSGPDSEAFRVVGVVSNVKQAGLTDDAAQGAVYYPYIYRPDNNIFVVLRGSIRPQSLVLTVQRVVRQIDPELVVSGLQSMDERITSSLMARRSPALLGGIFSAIALLLIAIGTYGLLSYAVAQRSGEIAVRIALGARPGQISGQFFFFALRLVAGGITLGLAGAWLTGQAMQAVLFHVPAHNPAILAGSVGVTAAVSLAACLLPAHRAARISPVRALADQ